jgi:hypothetical protein
VPIPLALNAFISLVRHLLLVRPAMRRVESWVLSWFKKIWRCSSPRILVGGRPKSVFLADLLA